MKPKLFRKTNKWLFAPSRRKKLSKKVQEKIRQLQSVSNMIGNERGASLHAIEYYRTALAVQKTEENPDIKLMENLDQRIKNAQREQAAKAARKCNIDKKLESRRLLLEKLKNKQRLPKFRK